MTYTTKLTYKILHGEIRYFQKKVNLGYNF